MFVRKRFMQAKQRQQGSRRFHGILWYNVRVLLSSLVIPLIFGLITIVLTLNQQKGADRRWGEHMNISREQKLQDESRSQKKIDHEWKIAINQYRNKVFLNYMKEMGVLLKESKSLLTNNPLTHTIARFKTLTVLRQLDGLRQQHVIRFLHEARQLTNTNESNALDISTAELIDIHYDTSSWFLRRGKISLGGVFLQNSTFREIMLHNVNFSNATLHNVNFSTAHLDNVTFSPASLSNVNFSNARLEDVSFLDATLRYANFSNATLLYANFANATLRDSNFANATLLDANFANAILLDVNFANATFLDANFLDANFENPTLLYANFANARLSNVNFSSTRLNTIDFSSAFLHYVTFSSARFLKGSSTSNFRQANMAHTIFVDCKCNDVDFSYANLENASFRGATLDESNFLCANLQEADFTNTTITDSQLRSALSIRDAKLPNGTLGHGHNLVKNGDADCNITLVKDWQVENGSIAVVASKEDPSDCQFSLQSLVTGATMSQRIVQAQFWNSFICTNSIVKLQANMSSGVSIELSGINSAGTILNKIVANSTKNRISMKLQKDMDKLQVIVKFNAHTNENNIESIWCDNIELFVDYDVS